MLMRDAEIQGGSCGGEFSDSNASNVEAWGVPSFSRCMRIFFSATISPVVLSLALSTDSICRCMLL